MMTGHPIPNSDQHGHDNRDAMIRFGLCAALAFLFASSAPSGLMPAVLGALLTIGAMATATLATLLGEDPFADHLTRWDEAAALMLGSMIASHMVDPAVIEALSKGQQVLGN